MTRILRPARAAGAALALIALATCSRGGGGAPTKLLIGATLPLTGAEARIGGFFKEGYDLAVEQVNQRGGVQVGQAKLPVTLTLLDDTSTQATAVSLADRLINNDKVAFLLGTYASRGGGATDIYRRGYKYLLGIIAPVELLGTTLMRWIDEEQKAGKLPRPARIALLWENTAHGKDFRKGVSDFAAKSGGAYTVAVDESFELNGKDFSGLLGAVKAARVDLFLVDAHLPDYITMHRQYVSAGLCHPIVSYGARGSEKSAIGALALHRRRAGRHARPRGGPRQARRAQDAVAPAGWDARVPGRPRAAGAELVRRAAEHAGRRRAHRLPQGRGDRRRCRAEPEVQEVTGAALPRPRRLGRAARRPIRHHGLRARAHLRRPAAREPGARRRHHGRRLPRLDPPPRAREDRKSTRL